METEKWEIYLVESNFFVNKHREIVNVTEDYANNIIDTYHN